MDKNTCRKNFYNILYNIFSISLDITIMSNLVSLRQTRAEIARVVISEQEKTTVFIDLCPKHILKSIITSQIIRYASVVCGLFCLQLLYSLSYRSIVKYKQVHHLGLPVLLPIFITSFVTVCSFF